MATDSKFSILIVDDEKTNLDVLNFILKPIYTVYMAKSGLSALKRVTVHLPDLILLDVVMPDMSGFEVLTKLKKMPQTSHIPVIFITGLTNVEDEEKGFFLGAVDYITKPFHNSIVQARVKTHLQIVKQMRTIERLGMIDALTDIPNRRCFDHQVNVEWNRAIREGLPISILMIDVDKFKEYNDTYGHPQGDVLLQELARALMSSLKRPADILARYGGEEFCVILSNTELEGAMQIAEGLRADTEALKVYTESGHILTRVTISIGVASMRPTIDDTVVECMSRADKALYHSKNTGRNKITALPI